MANTVNFLKYSRGSGSSPFLRIYAVAFNGSYVQNYGEILNFNTANNPNGLEYDYVPVEYPTNTPFIIGSTLAGWTPELQIGGTTAAGEFGINFYNGTTQLTAEAYSVAGFPSNTRSYLPSGTWYGEVLIGIMTQN